MFSFGDHVDEFRGRFPRVPPLEAKAFIWQANRDVFNDHFWPFAIKQGSIITESEYGTGTIAVTNGSTAVTMTGGVWIDAWTVAPSVRRFVGQSRNENYGITLAQPNGTLDAPWQGITNTAATYTLYRDIYPLPADCDFMKAYFIIEPTRNIIIPMKDYGVFVRRKVGSLLLSQTGIPDWVTFVGLTTTGIPQVQFGPFAPSASEIYTLLYFAKPTMPTSMASQLSPMIPQSFEDMVWRRAVWQASVHPRYRRAEWMQYQQEYYDRLFEAKSQLDGQSVMSRQLRATVPGVGDDLLDDYFAPRVRYTA